MFFPLKSTKTQLNPWKTWALFCWPKPNTAAWQWWKNRKHTWIGIAQLLCSYFWIILELVWSHSAVILQLFCNPFAAIWRLFYNSFAAILQLFWSYFPMLWFGFVMFFLFSNGFYKVWVGTSWVSTRISLGKFVGLDNQEKPSQTVWQATLWSSFCFYITNCVFKVA